MKRILVVDDEPAIVTLLEYNLEKAGYQVESCQDGLKAYQQAKTQDYDFIILDLMLPGMDGIEICRQLRQDKIETPILMLTAKADEYDKIIGLELGADDYMTKPFSPREVVARIKAILRRTKARNAETDTENQAMHREAMDYELEELTHAQRKEHLVADENESEAEESIQLGEITIYPNLYQVEMRGEPVDITPKEFELLVYMALRKGRVLSRDQLLDSIWDFDYDGGTRIVDVHISHLREKLEEDSKNPRYIKTLRGFGYKFEVPEE